MLTNTNRYSDSQNALRGNLGNGTTSITNIYLDNEQIFGEGINSLFVIEDIRTDAIKKITRSNVGYDKTIHIYKK